MMCYTVCVSQDVNMLIIIILCKIDCTHTYTNKQLYKQGRSYHCFLVAQKPPQELLRKLGRAPYN